MKKTASQIATDVVEKAAARREIKELRKGVLGPKELARLVANNRSMRNEREIKFLGSGATMKADLVMHPEHGFVVRKHVRYPTHVKDIATHPNVDIYNTIKKYQDKHGPSGFGRVHQVDPRTGLVFQEFVSGPTLLDERMATKKRTMDFLDREELKAKRTTDKFRRGGLRSTGDYADEFYTAAQRGERVKTLRKRIWRLKMKSVPFSSLSREQQKLVDFLRKSYPNVYDYNAGQNLMRTAKGFKSIDASGTTIGIPHALDSGRTRYDQFKERAKALTKALTKAPIKTPGRTPVPRGLGMPARLGLGALGVAALGGAAYALRRYVVERPPVP